MLFSRIGIVRFSFVLVFGYTTGQTEESQCVRLLCCVFRWLFVSRGEQITHIQQRNVKAFLYFFNGKIKNNKKIRKINTISIRTEAIKKKVFSFKKKTTTTNITFNKC